MKIEDHKKTIDELRDEIEKNNEQNDKNDERKRMSMVNQIGYKVSEMLFISLFPYFGLFGLSLFLEKSGSIASLASTILGKMFPLVVLGGSLCIGAVGRILIDWKCKKKERLKAFTTAKTEAEKIEEEVKYTAEIEKTKNRNKAIAQAMYALGWNQLVLDSLSNRYDINDRTIPQTEEDAKKRFEDLLKILEDKNNELDLLTTQKVLHEKFWEVRDKTHKVMNIVVSGMMGGFVASIFGCPSLTVVRDYLTSLETLISLFTPFIAGAMGTTGYLIKSNRDHMKAFNSLNNQLGENALPKKLKNAYEEQKDLAAKIKSKIDEISSVEVQLQEQKRNLESFSTEDSEKDQTLEESLSKDQTLEVARDNSNESECTQDDLMSFLDKKIKGNQSGEKRLLLVPNDK